MPILKLKGFLFEPSDPAVYDRDSKTVLELCGRLGYKINQLIDEYNRFYNEMTEKYEEAYSYMVTNLPIFVSEQLPVIAPGIMQELWGTDIEGLLQDMSDLKATYKFYNGLVDLKTTGEIIPVGAYVKTSYYLLPNDNGGATYQIIDHLEEGEVANDEDIIALGESEEPTKWARLYPHEFVKSSCFLSLQHAINYAYPRNLKVMLTGRPNAIEVVEGDLIIPYEVDYAGNIVEIFSDNEKRTIEVSGQIKMPSEASTRNFIFKNITFTQPEDSILPLFGFIPSGLGTYETDTIFDNCLFINCYLELTNIYHFNIINTNFVDSYVLLYEASEFIFVNCKFNYSDSYTGIGIKVLDCGYSNFTNCYLNSENISPLHILNGSNVKIENLYYNASNSKAIEIESSENCSINNLVVVGRINDTKAINCYDSNNISFNEINSYALIPNGNLDACILLDSSSKCTINNISCNSLTMVSLSNSNENIIYAYNKLISQNLVSGTGSNNFIYLDNEDDISLISSNIKFEIRTEVKAGNNTTMETLTPYEGRIYYNTELNATMIYTNNEWKPLAPITEINPSKINCIDFGNSLVSFTNRSNIRDNIFLSTTNEDKLIEILNHLIDNNETMYFFINKSEDPNEFKLFKITTDFSNVGGARFLLDIIWLNIPSDMKYNEQYIVNVSYGVTLTDGYVSDITGSSSYLRSIYNLIPTNNTTDFTPTSSANPATKGYVDSQVLKYTSMPSASSSMEGKVVQYIGTSDSTYTKGHFYECVSDGQPSPTYSWQEISFGGGGGTSIERIYSTQLSASSTINFSNGTFSILGVDDTTKLINILMDAKTNNYNAIIVYITFENSATSCLLGFITKNINLSSSNTNVPCFQYYNCYAQSNLEYNGTASGYQFIQVPLTCSNNVITSIGQGMGFSGAPKFLSANNSNQYTPTNDYNPATKKYVDDYSTPKYETMPTATASLEGMVVQYVGATDSSYTKGYFYECVSDEQATPTYSWEVVEFPLNQPIFDLLSTLRCDVGNIMTSALVGDSYFKKSGNMYTLMVCIEITQAQSSSNHGCLLAIPLTYNPSSISVANTIVIAGTGQRSYSSGGGVQVSSFGVFGYISSLYSPTSEKEVALLSNDLTANVGDYIYINLTWFK